MTGDLIFVKPTNVMGKLVAFFGGSKYCHVGILTDDFKIAEINLGYEFNIRPMTYTSYDTYRVIGDFSASDLMMVINNKIGMKYDLLDIFRIFFNFQASTPNKVICSEVVNQCFCLLGIELSNKKIPSPQDLIDGGKLERV